MLISMPELAKHCKDCPPEGKRPAPFPGPRCATHHREVKKVRSDASHDKMVGNVYGLEPGEYWRLYDAQGGKCAICGWAKGKVRRLAVDHDHETGAVRGLLCSVCNRFVGYIRNDPEAFLRGYTYLTRALEANLERQSRTQDSPPDGTGDDSGIATEHSGSGPGPVGD